jgi:hypothetical protein
MASTSAARTPAPPVLMASIARLSICSALSHRTRQARIATPLPMGSRETVHPSDNRHSASNAKNSDENQIAAIQRKAKTKTRE